MNLFYKYTVLLGSILLLAAGSITALALIHHRRALTREALLRGESIAVNLALVSADAILTKNVLQLVPLSMDATTRHENVVYAAVADKAGVVLAHPDREAIHKPFEFKQHRLETAYGVQADVGDGQGMGQAIWDVSVPVKAKGSLVELGRVHVGIDKRIVEASVDRSLRQLLLVSILCLVLGLAVAFYASRFLVRPLELLSEASARVGRGDLTVSVPFKSKDELGALATNFNSMVRELKLAEERKVDALRIEGELQLAHTIQNGLFPSKEPDMPGYETAFYCQPAKELGGDYYDWYPVDGGRKFGFVVADVSGKGVPAALHMTNLRNFFRFTTDVLEDPRKVLMRVNELTFPELKGEAFVTLVYAVLDPLSGVLRYVNAGHDPLLWYRAESQLVTALESTGFPVGMVDAVEFDVMVQEESITMEPGDMVFMFTDGVTEAEDRRGRQFGLVRIGEVVAGKRPRQAVEDVRKALEDYLAGQPAPDDVTLLCLRRNPLEEAGHG